MTSSFKPTSVMSLFWNFSSPDSLSTPCNWTVLDDDDEDGWKVGRQKFNPTSVHHRYFGRHVAFYSKNSLVSPFNVCAPTTLLAGHIKCSLGQTGPGRVTHVPSLLHPFLLRKCIHIDHSLFGLDDMYEQQLQILCCNLMLFWTNTSSLFYWSGKTFGMKIYIWTKRSSCILVLSPEWATCRSPMRFGGVAKKHQDSIPRTSQKDTFFVSGWI